MSSFGNLVGNRPQSAAAQAGSAIEKNNGSLTAVPPGTVRREGSVWDVGAPWHGRELTGYMVRKSLWSKDTLVSFYWTDGRQIQHNVFTLHLDLKLPPPEVARAASTYMMLLNLARQQ